MRSAVVAEDARTVALQQVGGNPDKIISNIRIDAPTQVQLRVKVAEVQRDALKRVGVNWQNINTSPCSARARSWRLCRQRPSRRPEVPRRRAAHSRPATTDLNTFIDFLATQNQATVLAEPNLIAMSGETASFLAGGEIPMIVPQGGLASTITVQYKQVGVSLAFTPTIIGDRINLKVAPEVSELSAVGSVSVPITSTAIGHRYRRSDPQGIHHDRTGQRPELRHRRPAASDLAAGHHQDPVARRHPGARHAVQVGRLPARGDRAGHHHHAVLRRADQRPAAHAAHRSRAADRCRPSGHAALQPSDAAAPHRGRARDRAGRPDAPASNSTRSDHESDPSSCSWLPPASRPARRIPSPNRPRRHALRSGARRHHAGGQLRARRRRSRRRAGQRTAGPWWPPAGAPSATNSSS